MTTKIKTSVKRSRFFISSLVGFLAVSVLSMFLPSIDTQQDGSVIDIPHAHADTPASCGSCDFGGGDGYTSCNCDSGGGCSGSASGCDSGAGCDGCAGSEGACE